MPTAIAPALGKEINLQRLYLDIERTHTSDRLEIDLQLRNELSHDRALGFIFQLFVEDAVRHCMPGAACNIWLSLAARRDGAGLALVVENGGSKPADAAWGASPALKHVRHGLSRRFGDRASMQASARLDGGLRVFLAMPLTGV